jgi:hypothetical protein
MLFGHPIAELASLGIATATGLRACSVATQLAASFECFARGGPQAEEGDGSSGFKPSHWTSQRILPAHLGGVAGAGAGTGELCLRRTTVPSTGLSWAATAQRAGLPDTLALTLRVLSMIVRADRAGAQRNAGTGRGVSAWRG